MRRDRSSSATMREQVERLTKLATDLLDLSRLDAGRIRVESEHVDLASVAHVLEAEFRPLAERRGHRLEVDVDGEPIAIGDELRVLQVGRALVDNALVHTPAGSAVRIRAWSENGDGAARDRRRRSRHPAGRTSSTSSSGSTARTPSWRRAAVSGSRSRASWRR